MTKTVIFVERRRNSGKTNVFQIVDCLKSFRMENVSAKTDISDLDINVNIDVELIKNGKMENVFASQNMPK